MGLGDAKLLSAIGFWFGWISIPFILFFSSFIALLFAIPDLIKNLKQCHQRFLLALILYLAVYYIFLIEQIIKFLN